MKKILLSFIILVVLSFNVYAANVGVVVLIPNGHIYSDCISINDGQSAYDAFQKTGLNMDWQNFGFGYFLNSVEGYASDNNAGKYWSFWHINSQGNDFEAAMVGASDYKISSNDKVIGLSLTAYDLAYNPITSPPFFDYDSICENPMKILSVKFTTDSNTKSVSNGNTISVKPSEKIKVAIKIENLDTEQELSNVEAVGVIKNLDGDLEDSDSTSINEGDKGELDLTFDVPTDASERKYDMTLTITGKGELSYTSLFNYKINVNKESHELKTLVPSSDVATCEKSWNLNLRVTNLGSNDEDAIFKVYNDKLGLLSQDTMSISEGDMKTKSLVVKIPSDAKGNYLVTTTVEYSDISNEYITSLDVDCAIQNIDANNQVISPQNQAVQQPPFDNSQTLKDTNSQYVFVDTTTNNDGGITTNTIFLVFANILLAGFIIFLILK